MKESKEIRLRLGHSPDPDDAFMFYGLAKDKLPTGPYRFQHVLQDIQTLNQRAMKGELEITAISIHAYPYVADKYALTSCGSSMGDKYGPMVITREPRSLEQLRGKTIAIPGKLTTAFLALQLCLGRGVKLDSPEDDDTPNPAFRYVVAMFDEIPAYVRDGKVDAGLIIHEGQLTFQKLGLHLVVDLGAWWHERTGLPLPMGGNAIKRELGEDLMHQVSKHLHRSIVYSMEHREDALAYAMQFARDMPTELADRFVAMWVNDLTLDYGERGREGVRRLLREGVDAGIIPHEVDLQFVD
jgi:1,4-dihydroxy-6-naphthoate synthase